jgi:hypothetical protein
MKTHQDGVPFIPARIRMDRDPLAILIELLKDDPRQPMLVYVQTSFAPSRAFRHATDFPEQRTSILSGNWRCTTSMEV